MKKDNNKKYVLCIETTSKICGISLCADNEVCYSKDLDLGLNHSITLFNEVLNAFKALGIDMSSIELIKVSSGPGSFTGIRIGIATALGLAIPYNTKIEYIDTLDSFCTGISNRHSIIVSMIDAKNDRVYMSIYNGVIHKKLIKDLVINIKDLTYLINKNFAHKNIDIYFVGPGANIYGDFVKSSLDKSIVCSINNIEIKSSNLYFTKGIASKHPTINYVLASKAEREHSDKH